MFSAEAETRQARDKAGERQGRRETRQVRDKADERQDRRETRDRRKSIGGEEAEHRD